jgi:hypothetical protein
MASLIRLKQIESGSSLQDAADIGQDFNTSVYEIIDGAGLFSSSAQVDLVDASNYDGFVVQLDMTMSSDLERNILSASISQSVSILSQTYVTTASLNTLSSSIANTDSQSLYLIGLLSSSVQATTGDFSSSVASQFSSSYATIYSISSSMDTTINNLSSSFNTSINNLSSSIATTISASEAGQTVLSGAISTTITNLSSSIATTISASEAGQLVLSGAISTTINNLSTSVATSLSASEAGQTALSGAISTTITNLSSSIDTTIDNLSSSINNRFIGIESVTASFESFSQSIDTTILNKMNVVGVISSSAQLDGSTLRNITIAPINSDGYSLIVSGAVAVVNATGLPEGGFGDTDSTVPAQIWLDGNQSNTASVPPVDPSTDNQPNSNQIDMGEF